MADTSMGFDAFVAKWVPPPPAWAPPGAAAAWRDGASEEQRRRGYREQMAVIGPELAPQRAARLRRDAAAGVEMLELLEGLLADPGVGSGEAAAQAVQRVFGVPPSRARFLASWRPGNRSEQARRVLERVALCIADARAAGLWELPAGCTDSD